MYILFLTKLSSNGKRFPPARPGLKAGPAIPIVEYYLYLWPPEEIIKIKLSNKP